MTKIAPTLHDYVMRPDAPGTSLLDRATLRAMQSELRALEAVARAAEKEAHGFMLCTPSGLRCEHTLCALIRALARLRGTEGRRARSSPGRGEP